MYLKGLLSRLHLFIGFMNFCDVEILFAVFCGSALAFKSVDPFLVKIYWMLETLLSGAESIGDDGFPITFLIGYIGFSFIL